MVFPLLQNEAMNPIAKLMEDIGVAVDAQE
jgi:hypothetical protein